MVHSSVCIPLIMAVSEHRTNSSSPLVQLRVLQVQMITMLAKNLVWLPVIVVLIQCPHRQHLQLHLPRRRERDLGTAAGELQVTRVQQLETVTLMLIAEPVKTCVQIVLACGVQWILSQLQAPCQRRCHHLQCHQRQCHLQCHQCQFPVQCQVIVLEGPWTTVLICAQLMYLLMLLKTASTVVKIVAPVR